MNPPGIGSRICRMRWIALALALVSAAVVAAAAMQFMSPDVEPAPLPASGMDVLHGFACRRGETKRIVTRGIEDDFAAAGAEPAEVHPRLTGLPIAFLTGRQPHTAMGGYDELRQDVQFVDWIGLPSRAVSGVLVLKLRPLGDISSDGIEIGDLSTKLFEKKISEFRLHYLPFREIGNNAVWRKSGEVYWAPLDALTLNAGGSLLALIQEGTGERPIDIAIADDTAVDFAGAALCLPPDTKRGVSLLPFNPSIGLPAEFAGFDCDPGWPGETHCDPFRGDTPCDTEQPLLCFADRAAAAPALPASVAASQDHFKRIWTGGTLAATPPVRGGAFRTIGEADAHCRRQFGSDWRVAEWHDGGVGWRFTALREGRSFARVRHWIDIRGAPHGACWGRNDGE